MNPLEESSVEDERRQLDAVQQDLLREFAALAPDEVVRAVQESARDLGDARVRVYLPVLVARQARRRLRETAPA